METWQETFHGSWFLVHKVILNLLRVGLLRLSDFPNVLKSTHATLEGRTVAPSFSGFSPPISGHILTEPFTAPFKCHNISMGLFAHYCLLVTLYLTKTISKTQSGECNAQYCAK